MAFVFEGTSLLQGLRQPRREAGRLHRNVLHHVMRTSDPTLRPGRPAGGRAPSSSVCCGDAREHDVALRLRGLETKLQASSAVVGAVLSLSADDEASLET